MTPFLNPKPLTYTWKLLLLSALAWFWGTLGVAQQSQPGYDIVCYSANENYHTKRLAAPHFYHNHTNRTTKNSTIIVNYVGFTTEAQEAFQFAVDIWESILHSEVPIRITASWSKLGANVLGSAGPSRFFSNFEGALLEDIMYPVALAEKLARTNLNPDTQADINANFNSDANWYFGTDGNTPTGLTDLVSVVMHEIGHGLGMVDTFNANATNGIWGSTQTQNLPVAYDYFVVNGQEQQLIDTSLFPNPSGALKDQLTSNNVFFSSNIVKTLLLGAKARLFAPDPFNGGSSIAHLDEGTFPAGDDNSLMTPQIGQAEAIHVPGDITLSIFAEMGWFYTFVDHTQLKDTENLVDPIRVEATITSDTLLVADQTLLHYSVDGFENSTSIQLGLSPDNLAFADIGPFPDGTEVSYYFSVIEQGTQRQLFSPGNAPNEAYSFAVGTDLQPPEILHLPENFLLTTSSTLDIEAAVTDNLGINGVTLEYNINDGISQTLELSLLTEESYFTQLDLSQLNLQDGDLLKYQIIATDLATSPNSATYPTSEFETIQVGALGAVASTYTNNFEDQREDFVGRGFDISLQDGFSTGAMHTMHPYQAISLQATNFIYLLKTPILIGSENPVVTFDEVVLVEPGSAGSAFGSVNFADFVVVEGSKDGGATWLPFDDGYDASGDPDWLEAYNSNVVNGVSTGTGSSSLFRSREIGLVGNGVFRSGDEVLIRFRLFDNGMNSGWGWVIDNLVIQEPVTNILDLAGDTIDIFPNPNDGRFIVDLEGTGSGLVLMKIFNHLGAQVHEPTITGLTPSKVEFEIRNPGVYFLQIIIDDKLFSKQIVVK